MHFLETSTSYMLMVKHTCQFDLKYFCLSPCWYLPHLKKIMYKVIVKKYKINKRSSSPKNFTFWTFFFFGHTTACGSNLHRLGCQASPTFWTFLRIFPTFSYWIHKLFFLINLKRKNYSHRQHHKNINTQMPISSEGVITYKMTASSKYRSACLMPLFQKFWLGIQL